jgi:hypothetical protein
MKTVNPITDQQRVRLAQLAVDNWRMLLDDPEIALAYVNGELELPAAQPATDAASLLPAESLYTAALNIAQERRDKLMRLRGALTSNDDQGALGLARELCGLGDDNEKRNRTHSRIN